ncbi:hypothetical protein K0B96_01425 [Horticoccus luteus]|uniref:Uncharacterized protein n=1 Tax=Horticoccus luteus TaxID=2862869 RepID=A0A8F9TXF2_9BACT|nr:hypothetical protein [Horticoccus luteus]QYM79307.1 hypothetical protein K0B96_01425 [Horticoccus luteus]
MTATFCVPAAQAADTSNPPPAELPQLDGVLHVGKVAYALFKGFDQTGHKWAVVGDDVGDFHVEKIHGVTVEVQGPDKKRSELIVTGWQSLERRQKTPEQSEAWINSAENPMLWHPVALPVQLQVRLADLNAEEKYDIQQWYLDYGWRMSVVIDATGYWDIGFEPAYGDARANRLNTQIARFRVSLNPEQARTYTEITKAVSYDEYNATREQRAQRMAAFIASLSPAQRRAFEALQAVDGGPIAKR